MSDIDKMSQHRVATIEPWHITEEEFRPERNEIAESLFSLAKAGLWLNSAFSAMAL